MANHSIRRLKCRLFSGTLAEERELRSVCLKWGFWSHASLKSSLTAGGYVLLYAPGEQGSWLGLVLISQGPFSSEMVYIWTEATYRRSGVGKWLIHNLCRYLGQQGGQEALFLEVRPSNQAAICLYESQGLRYAGMRQKYYADGEDALVYTLALEQSRL